MKINQTQATVLQTAISEAGKAGAKRSRPRIAEETGIDLDVIKAIKTAPETVQVTAAQLKALSASVGVDYKTLRGLS